MGRQKHIEIIPMPTYCNQTVWIPSISLAILHLSAAALSAASYSEIVLQDSPLAYYRLGDTPTALATARNSGAVGANLNGTHIGATHGNGGAIDGSADGSAYYNGAGSRTIVPHSSAINPPSEQPFTIEAWVRPTIDGQGNAQVPLFNRHSAGNRQGWVFFQRDAGTGWNFRMYNEAGSTPSIDITGGPYTVGDWTQIAATWDGVNASLYVNGQFVATAGGTYVANSDIPFGVGAYTSDSAGDNSFTGYVDEVAWYSNALSPDQILAHFTTATDTARTTACETLVENDGAVLYLRLNEPGAANLGTAGPEADGTHTIGVRLGQPGALAGSTDTAAAYTGLREADGGSPTTIPFQEELNPAGSFTVEAWLKPTVNGYGNAQSPLHNRTSTEPDAGGNRSGWDFFQRDAAVGWNFRMFNGAGSGRLFDLTGGPYTVSEWQHLVAVYDAAGPSATLYLNGQEVASSTTPNGTYAAKTVGDMAIGSYGNPARNPSGYENAFTGSIDEVAIYPSALSSASVLAHYRNGTNAARSTPYETLITSDNPAGYWRLNEAPYNSITNSGTLGSEAQGVRADAPIASGPTPPAYGGFETNNMASRFDGATSFIELFNPTNLNFSGPITLEAWILPDAVQDGLANILAHGVNAADNRETVMRLTDSATYTAGSWDGVSHTVGFPIPGGDLGGGTWIHLVTTYDGTEWTLYRNGVEVASQADTIGAVPVDDAAWAIGARGRWSSAMGISAPGFPDRSFSGQIDEVAIYDQALSAARVAAHYSAGLLGPNPLTIQRSGNDIVLTWTSGTLQSADLVEGPYTDVAEATAPTYTVPIGVQPKFYRLRL